MLFNAKRAGRDNFMIKNPLNTDLGSGPIKLLASAASH
jgi:hypothetical protein